MMVMTAKVDMKKILTILAIVAAVIFAVILMSGDDTTATSTAAISNNDDRVEFLRGFGWEVAASPVETGQVRIPGETSEVFDRYNALQKSQGYDLSAFAGQDVMRYVYKVSNYPGATEPVYATVLVYKGQVIGGDITDTAVNGQIHGFTMPRDTATSLAETKPAA